MYIIYMSAMQLIRNGRQDFSLETIAKLAKLTLNCAETGQKGMRNVLSFPQCFQPPVCHH